MLLKNNPFYILEVTSLSNRNEIISKAEEQSFFLESNECDVAQSILLNPIKRLEAEINWFPGIKDTHVINRIRNNIENSTRLDEEDFSSIAKLNAIIYNISLQNTTDNINIIHYINILDELYASLNPVDILDIINSDRAIAGFNEANINDLEKVLLSKRTDIRNVISELLEATSEEEYISIINSIADKFINSHDYNHDVVIDDIIDQYELKMHSIIEQKTEELFRITNEVGEIRDKAYRRKQIDFLIKLLKEWDKYAQPLQLKARAEGRMHSISENLAKEIRNTSIRINNIRGDVDDAIKLFEALKDVFAELPEFMEIINEDAGVLAENKRIHEIVKTQEKEETKGVAIRWLIRIAIFAAIIFCPTMCDGNDSSYDDYSNDAYYEDEEYSEEEGYSEEEEYIEVDMPESGYVFSNTFDSRPCTLTVTNTSSDAYLLQVTQDGKMLYGFIAPNSTGQIYMPLGECTIYYSHGSKWYGESDKFGDGKISDGYSFETIESGYTYSIAVPFED